MQLSVTYFQYFCHLRLIDFCATVCYNIHTNRNTGDSYEHFGSKEFEKRIPVIFAR